MTKAEYAEYLLTEHWRETRLTALERADNRCQLCNRTKELHVHHRTYARIGCEEPGDLTVLCRGCHEHFHFGGTKAKAEKPPKTAKPKKPKQSVDWVAVEALMRHVLAQSAGGLSVREMAAATGLKRNHIGQHAARMRREGRLTKRGQKFRLKGTRPTTTVLHTPSHAGTQMRRARVRKVRCPRCGAEPGERCQSDGQKQEKNHAERLEVEYRQRREHSRV